MCKINSNSECKPPGDTTEITTFIEDYLNEVNIPYDKYESAEKMFNLVASIGNGKGKELVYCGHTDVVPVGDLSKWEFNPFSGEVKDGWMLGRGASDMKAGLAGIIFATKMLKKTKYRTTREINTSYCTR